MTTGDGNGSPTGHPVAMLGRLNHNEIAKVARAALLPALDDAIYHFAQGYNGPADEESVRLYVARHIVWPRYLSAQETDLMSEEHVRKPLTPRR